MNSTEPRHPHTIAVYDSARRARAREAGEPIRRTKAPGIIASTIAAAGSVDDVAVWLDERGTLRTCLLAKPGRPARLTARLLDKALVTPERGDNPVYPDLARPRRLIVADEVTARRLLGAAQGWERAEKGTAGRALGGPAQSLPFRVQFALGLVASTRLVVLTRALSRCYWLPAGLDPDALTSWRQAFGIGGSEPAAGAITRLAERAREGATNRAWERHAFKSESAALNAARFRGLRAAVTVYSRAAAADAATRAILTTDPLLLERGMIDGSVSRLRMLNVHEATFTASVSLPFRLRPGKQVLLVDPQAGDANTASAETTLQAVRVETIDGHDLVTVRIAGASRKSHLSRLIENVARRPSRELYVAEAPYLPFHADTLATRWTQKPGARQAADAALGMTKRDVPLDVLIAGAPDENPAISET